MCYDEAQMAGGAVTAIAIMAERISARHTWAVTGGSLFMRHHCAR